MPLISLSISVNFTLSLIAASAKEYAKLKVVEPKNAYLNGIIQANPGAFKEAMLMSAEAREIIMTTAEEIGWLDERDKRRDAKTAKAKEIEIAKNLKMKNIPINVISETTTLTLQEVEEL